MIELTRLNGNCMMVNSDLIHYIDSTPDTTLTLVTGDRLVVLESSEEVRDRTLRYRAQVLQTAWPSAQAALAAHTSTHAR